MVGNPEAAEELVEVLAVVDVVVGMQHIEEKTLPETSGADEEKEIRRSLQNGDKHRLVDEVIVVSPYLFEVRDAVGKKFNYIHNMLVVKYKTVYQCCMTER